MDSTTLAELIEQRHDLLVRLIELGERQQVAIEHGRMSELLATLNEKQSPLQELGEVSDRLRTAIGDAPEDRNWPSEAARSRCLAQHEACEQMLKTLLAQEATCEAELTVRRDEMEQRLARSEGARRAVSGYAAADRAASGGGSLDLSSD